MPALGAHSASQLLTPVSNLQPELPPFEAHQHAAELVPCDLPAIDVEERHIPILSVVPLDHSPHNLMFRDLHPKGAVLYVLDRQSTAHLFDQPPKERKKIFLGITDDLKLIARQLSVLKLESVESDAWAK